MIEKKNLRDSYRFYRETTEDSVADIILYLKVVLGFIKYMMGKVFDGYDVKLSVGNSLGIIGVRGTKDKPKLDEFGNIVGLATDWKATNELRKIDEKAREEKTRVYHFNEHTAGVRYRLVWFRGGTKVPNSGLYSLEFTKGLNGNKRTMSRMVKQGKEYLVTVTKEN